MTSEKQERDWVADVGAPAYASIVEMVAALECDYARLEELRDERRDIAEAFEDAVKDRDAALKAGDTEELPALTTTETETRQALIDWDNDNAEELKELEEEAGECMDKDNAYQRILEDALSVEVRSGWYSPGNNDNTPEEFQILLCTGGPAVRIMGDLDEHGEPYRAWLEVQDWFKPWTQYFPADQDTLLAYARCFCFAS